MGKIVGVTASFTVIEFIKLPPEVKNMVAEIRGFGNGRTLELSTEVPAFTEEAIHEWYMSCRVENYIEADMSYEEFIKQNCKLEWWIVKNVDLEDPDLPIIIDICW